MFVCKRLVRYQIRGYPANINSNEFIRGKQGLRGFISNLRFVVSLSYYRGAL